MSLCVPIFKRVQGGPKVEGGGGGFLKYTKNIILHEHQLLMLHKFCIHVKTQHKIVQVISSFYDINKAVTSLVTVFLWYQ